MKKLMNKEEIKKSFSSRQFKMGSYQTIITVIIIVAIVFSNLLFNKLNIMVDLSSDKKFSLTEESKKLVQGLADKVIIYRMHQDKMQDIEYIKKVMDQYSALGGKLTVVDKDPVQYPKFATEYTQEQVNDGDIIVVNENTKRAKHVSVEDMIPGEMDYTTGDTSYKVLDVEGQVTAAIQSVTSVDFKKLYCTKGHEEMELSASLNDVLNKSNMEVTDTRIDAADGIPKDCDILMMNGLKYDLLDAEVKNITTYLENGGKAMFFLNPAAENGALKNLYGLLNNYGILVNEGIVLETEGHYVEGYPNAVEATVESHDITKDVLGDKSTIAANTKGFTLSTDVRSTLSLEKLLTTSEESFSRVSNTESSMEKVKGDLDGPFTLGVAVTDEYKEKKTQIVVFGSNNIADNSFIGDDRYGNRSIVLNSVSWLNGQETSTLVIPKRSLEETKLEVPDKDKNLWTAALVVVLPIAILGFGFFIWYRRRKS